MLKLQHVDNPGRYIKLTSLPVTIGRDDGNDMVLDAQGVSDFHAEINGDDGELYIVDLLSASGTVVNDQRLVERTRLNPWDIIRIGTVDLEINDPNTCRPGSWVLRTESDLLSSQFYTLQEKTVVGREPECDLTIDWYLLSRRHAELLVEGDHLRVVDLDSRNGTFINGERIQDAIARPGDEIRFDEQRFVVVGPSRADLKPGHEDDRTQLRLEDDPERTQFSPGGAAGGNPEQVAPDGAMGQVAPDGAMGQVAPDGGVGQGPDELATRIMAPAAQDDETRLFVPGGAPVEPPPEALLVLDAENRKGERYALESEVQCIGRAPGNDLVLEENGVSKKHAEIFQTGGQWYIRDLNSRNGTRVNGSEIEESPLQSGDRIALGHTEMVFQFEEIGAGAPDGADTVIYRTTSPPQRNAAMARAEVAKKRVAGPWLWGGLGLLVVLAGGLVFYGFRSGVL